MTRHLRLLLALVAAAALFVTGCGGDDDDDGGVAASGSASGSEASADEGGEEEIDPEAVEDAAQAVGMDEDCAEAVAAFASVSAGAGAAFSGGDSDLEDSLEAFQAYAEVAPDEIQDDMEVLAEAYGEFIEAIVDSGYDASSGEAPPDEVMEALEDLDSEELSAANERISAYFENECGDLDVGE
jgi:hypothetical protein